MKLEFHVTAGLKSGEDVKIKSDAQVAGALGAMFGGLSDPALDPTPLDPEL